MDPETPNPPDPKPPIDPVDPVDPVDPKDKDKEKEKDKDKDKKPDETKPTIPDNDKDKNENTFDPSTLYAVNTVKERVKKRQSQVLVTIDPEEAEVLPEPKSKIDSINESGSVKLLFSQSMLFEETFGGF